ncbi:aminotransferase [Clostridium cavendishii DSM 21758]|uniref:Aminotransferase n=1 Tax=Clostridium cavendishii DSM 21758 TaxID=1121302 RepID=A0A1M6KYV5_9CLOT|nr:aminotransferase class I/II-fold pyridoxal phosphate-dependent enzyme [Clostridium cavendishii]SHJ64181.1 aminotransferase [Clostridium cavendishii DSM 21758]
MNKRVEAVQISGIRKVYNKASKYDNVISLTLGQPDFPVPDIINKAMIRAIEDGKTVYTSNAGILELRREICNYLRKININYNPEEVIITVGGSEGLYATFMAILNEGDKVLMPAIGYPAYENITKMLGGTMLTYDLNGDFSINFDSLIQGLDNGAKVLVLSYPSNPLGATLSKDDKEKLYKIIKDRDILIITDEIYASLCFEDGYNSIAQYEDIKEKIIYISGFSKMFSMTGLRLGYVCANSKYIDQIVKVHQYGVSCAPSIVQWAVVDGLKYCMNEINVMKASFIERKNFVYKKLLELGLEVNDPKGAFYIFPSIKKFNMTSEEFCDRLLESKRIACVPGTAFGDKGEGYIRISYCYSKESLEKALEGIEEFIKEL